jgi:uridylate kinase
MERLIADENGMRKSMHNAARLADAIGSSAVGFRAMELSDPALEVNESNRLEIEYILRHLTYNNETQALLAASESAEKIVVAGGGIGRGHVSTDFGAALWARGVVSPDEPTVLLKGSDVDHIYTDNPKLNPAAKPLYHISYRQARDQGLEVVDLAAWPILEGGKVSTIIYMDKPGAMKSALDLEDDFGTLVDTLGMRMTA